MNDIDREAVVAFLAGEASVEESRHVMEWRTKSPENRDLFDRIESLWEATGRVVPGPTRSSPPSPRAIVEIARGRQDLDERDTSRPEGEEDLRKRSATVDAGQMPGSGGALWVPAGIAAALLVGLGIGFGIAGGVDGARFGPDSFVTGDGEVATVMLQDETVVRLAPDSRLVFSRDNRTREVSLFGRAYFAVSRDERRPFRVRLPSGDVEVLGTRFDVEGRGRGIRVAVVEGEVRMDAGGARLSVRANQVARMIDGERPALEEVDDVYQVIDWLGRFLVFESTPMTEVVDEFEGRFDLDIEIRDPELRERTVTGWFAGQSPDEMIDGICRVIDARCTIREQDVLMEIGS